MSRSPHSDQTARAIAGAPLGVSNAQHARGSGLGEAARCAVPPRRAPPAPPARRRRQRLAAPPPARLRRGRPTGRRAGRASSSAPPAAEARARAGAAEALRVVRPGGRPCSRAGRADRAGRAPGSSGLVGRAAPATPALGGASEFAWAPAGLTQRLARRRAGGPDRRRLRLSARCPSSSQIALATSRRWRSSASGPIDQLDALCTDCSLLSAPAEAETLVVRFARARATRRRSESTR